jgi:hypothetical protein
MLTNEADTRRYQRLARECLALLPYGSQGPKGAQR